MEAKWNVVCASVAAGGLLALALWVWMGPTGEESPVNPSGVAAGAQKNTPSATGSKPTASNRRAAPAAAQRAVRPAEEALHAIATVRGEGWVRCAIPAGSEGKIAIPKWGSAHDGVLSMRVATPSGQELLLPDTKALQVELMEQALQASPDEMEDVLAQMEAMTRLPAVGLLEWEGAQPGQQGRCELLPAPEGTTETVASDDEADFEPEDADEALRLEEAMQRQDDALDETEDRIDEDADAELARLTEALATPGLSAEASAQIKGWIADVRGAHAQQLQDLLDAEAGLQEALSHVLGGVAEEEK